MEITSQEMELRLKQEGYSQQDILKTKATLQRREHCILQRVQLNHSEVFLMCENTKKNKCKFVIFFKKVRTDNNDLNYSLIMTNQTHSEDCISSRGWLEGLKNSPIKPNITIATGKSPQKQGKYAKEKTGFVLNGNQDENFHEFIKNPTENQSPQKSKKSSIEQESSFEFPNSGIDKSQTIYREEQISSLKKKLVNQYNALISKSTHMYPDTNIINRITFKCKFSQKNECDFEQRLNLIENSEERFFQLEAINCNHRNECLMDSEELRYHQMTRRIDESMPLMQQIIMRIAETGQGNIRPKIVLQMLGVELGQQSSNFIYQGLEKRNNRRAVKKYFDNAVGKIRNKYKS